MEKEVVIIGFAGSKGGIGKSALCTLVSSYIHYQTDLMLVHVDADRPQFSTSTLRQRDLMLINNNPYFKQMACRQFTELSKVNKKAYPIICSAPEEFGVNLYNFLQKEKPKYDIATVDFTGATTAPGVLEAMAQLDYIIMPIIVDHFVLDSCLKFGQVIQEFLIKKGNCRLKKMFLVWNMVDGREKTDLYIVYEEVIKKLGLTLLQTLIPSSVRFRKELVEDQKIIFRSTLFPPNPKLASACNIDSLVREIRNSIKI